MNEQIWTKHIIKKRKLFLTGLQNNQIFKYDENLINTIREINDRKLPALLLSSNKFNKIKVIEYYKTLLFAKVFINTNDDLKIYCATIDSVILKPNNKNNSSYNCARWYLARKTENEDILIYDSYNEVIINQYLFWEMENPKIKATKSKEEIKREINFIDSNDDELNINNFSTPKFN